MMIEIECRLIDSGDIDRSFPTLEIAQLWVRGIGEEYFQWVEMTVGDETVEGFWEILAYGRESNQKVD